MEIVLIRNDAMDGGEIKDLEHVKFIIGLQIWIIWKRRRDES